MTDGIAIDNNEIMARVNGNPGRLHLNNDGGELLIGGDKLWIRDGDDDDFLTQQSDDLWRKPIFFQRYSNLGDNINYNTGILTTDWQCGIAGFAALNGDIQENDAGDIVRLYTYRSGGTWRIRADFRSHNNGESWDVTLLCIDTALAGRGGF